MPVETIAPSKGVRETGQSRNTDQHGHTVVREAPRFYMDGGVLFHWGTEERKMTSSEDLGIFTGPHRMRAILKRFPEVTTIVQDRELVSRAEIFKGESV